MTCYQLCGQPRQPALNKLCGRIRADLSTGFQEDKPVAHPHIREVQVIDIIENNRLLNISTGLIVITIFLNIYRYI